MTKEEAFDYLEGLGKKGIKPGLKTVRELMDACGRPDDKLKFIHVAGTNGKGSTSLFISEILRAQGYRVGVYSSPAVFEDLEIIRVNGRNISGAAYGEIIGRIAEANTMGATRFEVETVAALMYFNEKNCDIVVLETGMGGLMDATNAVENKLVTVFTPIGMDHMQFLGDTLEKIALNKAGIMREGVPAVSAYQNVEAGRVLRDEATKLGTKVTEVSPDNITKIKFKLNKTTFNYREYKDLEIHLNGKVQVENAALAIEACLSFPKEYRVTEKSIRAGLLKAEEAGRFEVLPGKPVFVLDGAHNEPAALRLRESLETYFTKKNFIYIMGMFRDKDQEKVIDIMAGKAGQIITVTLPNHTRSLSAFELAELIRPSNGMVTTADSIFEAVELAFLMADRDTVVVVFGSLSHLFKAKKAIKAHSDRNVKNMDSVV